MFLDAGLTLVYSELSLAERCFEVGRERGLHLTRDAIEAAMPQAGRWLHHAQRSDADLWSSDSRVEQLWLGYYATLLREAGAEGEASVGECAAEVYRQYTQPGAWSLYPDVLPTLTGLKEEGCLVGVISDWGSELAGKVLLPLGVGPYINFMVISTVLREAKPGYGLYREALQRAGVEAHEAVHVGDNYITDVLGARSAGVAGILLDREGRHKGAALDCPRIGSLGELLPLLRGGLGRICKLATGP